MRKFILPAIVAAAVGLAFLPSHAQAGGFSISIGQVGYYPGGYGLPVYSGYSQGYYTQGYYGQGYTGYTQGYYGSPAYSGYYRPGFSYSQSYYSPSVYNYSQSYYGAPNRPYGYGGYSQYGNNPGFNNGWREHEEHEEHEHHR